jgi:hypothetical protein
MRACFLLSLLLLTTRVASAAPDSLRLFNGVDLSGWTFDLKDEGDPASVWSVEDGVLVCRGKPSGVIRTREDYRNYELTVEWRWPAGTQGGNSGALVHCSTPRQLGIWPKSIEVQLAAGNAGDFWVIGETIEVPAERTPKTGRRILNLTDGSEKPAGEWNSMRILCQGGAITVWVNDDLVNEGANCSATQGAICLQSEGTEIHFRKVELKPLN